jgi:hypothetical protein
MLMMCATMPREEPGRVSLLVLSISGTRNPGFLDRHMLIRLFLVYALFLLNQELIFQSFYLFIYFISVRWLNLIRINIYQVIKKIIFAFHLLMIASRKLQYETQSEHLVDSSKRFYKFYLNSILPL